MVRVELMIELCVGFGEFKFGYGERSVLSNASKVRKSGLISSGASPFVPRSTATRVPG
jgi:hypothetical protein